MLVEWWCQAHPDIAPWLAPIDESGPCPECGDDELVIRLTNFEDEQ